MPAIEQECLRYDAAIHPALLKSCVSCRLITQLSHTTEIGTKALLKGHCQPHEPLDVGDRDAKKVIRWQSGRVAPVGDCVPVVRCQRRTPLRAVGDAAHT